MMPGTSTIAVLAGRYQLAEPIASGGMGEVWRGTDLVLARPVAVKLLRPEYAGDPGTRARFLLEARSTARLAHPGIVQVYDYGEAGTPELPYLVMELVDGPSLAGVLAAGPLDPGQAMDVIAQVADGLDAAHAAGVIHRDIKPGNLLLGAGGRVKITDFGIAAVAGPAAAPATGAIRATPAYLAPERAAGAAATPACDLYSLGIVGYECLAGAPPFRGSPAEVAAAHREQPLPPLPAAVPGTAAALIAGLTARDPGARPATAASVARRARRLHAALSPGSPPAPLAGAVPGPAAPADGQPATLTGLPLPSTPSPRGRRRPSRGPRRERPRRSVPARPPAGRTLALAIAGSCAAGLAGWLAATVIPLAGAHQQATAGHSAGPVRTAARTVMVSSQELAGLPAATVLWHLRQLGLHPRLLWLPAAGQAPGTVISVRPGGRVPAGAAVVVAAAAAPRRDQDNGGGDGSGGGDGGGQGH